MNNMHENRKTSFSIATVLTIFLLVCFINSKVAQASEINLRPPYDGQHPLTSFFDHYYPNYGTTNGVTIYTGDSVNNCNPHCYQGHPGYDWSMAEGTPILAVANGTVENRIVSSSGYGNRLIIKHSNGYRSLYAHLRENNPFNVAIGAAVNQGDLIGWSGTTHR
jgi:murein DD-endopeptidase MepM/ murein hydrolase activator NlpD